MRLSSVVALTYLTVYIITRNAASVRTSRTCLVALTSERGILAYPSGQEMQYHPLSQFPLPTSHLSNPLTHSWQSTCDVPVLGGEEATRSRIFNCKQSDLHLLLCNKKVVDSISSSYRLSPTLSIFYQLNAILSKTPLSRLS
jgi:hypothetical protein